MREAFAPYRPLPIGDRGPDEVQYEGRHLITGEVVEHMKVNLALLESGIGAISFYIQELEYVCKVKNTHQVLAPLLQKFFEELLFGTPVSVFDPLLVKRLSDSDVREDVRAVFVPLIRRKVIQTKLRTPEAPPVSLSTWKPFQATVSERRPVHQSPRTVFNLSLRTWYERRAEVTFARMIPTMVIPKVASKQASSLARPRGTTSP